MLIKKTLRSKQVAYSYYDTAGNYIKETMKKAFTVYIDDDCKPETLAMFFTQKKESGEHSTHKIEKSFDSCDEEIAIPFDSE